VKNRFDFLAAELFPWRGQKLNNTKTLDRCTKAGLVASGVPIIFCAFLSGPSAASFFLVENIIELPSIFEHSLQARLFAVSLSYPLVFLVQFHGVKLCTKTRRTKCALLIGWSGLVAYFSMLSYSGFF